MYRDPETDIPFAQALYNDDTFLKAMFDSLTEDGIMVMQLGPTSNQNDPPDTHSRFKNRAKLFGLLEIVGFESIHSYEEVSALLVCYSLVRIRRSKVN